MNKRNNRKPFTHCLTCNRPLYEGDEWKLSAAGSTCMGCTEITALKEKVELLEATLDGDPNQMASPEQCRAWRLSAVRYADKLEGILDAVKDLTVSRVGHDAVVLYSALCTALKRD